MGRVAVDVDWLADVRRYAADADELVVKKICNYCGIALRKRDSSLVSFSDSKETDRVREKFLKKKLALTDDDATLDAAIAGVGERMKADRTKNRVTVYYLLAEHFGMLDLFGGTKTGTVGGGAAAAGGAAALASSIPVTAAPDTAPESTSSPEPSGPVEPVALASAATPASGAAPAVARGGYDWRRGKAFDEFEVGILWAAIVAALLAFVLLLAWFTINRIMPERAAAPAPVAAAAPAPVEAAPVPEGAGVVASERDSRPMVTVYFDVGKSDVAPTFDGTVAPVLAYLEANPDATVAISGFNDPSGNAALNAELSKNRAQSVQAALVALGVPEDRTDLVKPDDATTTDMTAEEARRVEVVVSD